MKIDAIDNAILQILKSNAKAGTKYIADQVGLSVTPTFERIRRLERNGVITGYTAKIDSVKLGRALKVYCQVTLKSHSLELIEQFERAVLSLEEVTQLHHIAGNIDYAMFIEIADMDAYQEFLRGKLAAIPTIASVHSSFVMKSLKQ